MYYKYFSYREQNDGKRQTLKFKGGSENAILSNDKLVLHGKLLLI